MELTSCLQEAQELGGRPLPSLDGNLCPIGTLPGFDSLIAEEVSAWLEEKLDCQIPNHAQVFLHDGHPLSIDQITDRLYQIVHPA